MLKKLILILLVLAPITMFAQDKIAYINSQEIFQQIPEFTTSQKALEQKAVAIQKNVDALRQEYMDLADKYKKSTDELTPSLIADRQKSLEQIGERINSFMETSQQEYQEAEQRALAPLQEKMQKAIKEVGDEHGFTYIFDQAMFLYVNPKAVDASKLVKTKLGIVG